MGRLIGVFAAVVFGGWLSMAAANGGPGAGGPVTAAAAPAPVVEGVNDSAGLPSISGHFDLQTLDGREVTDAAYRGKWLVVYFGYTSCPDVCPTVLLRVGQALASLGPLADKVQPVFVTLDPARDTQQRLTKYMAAFNSRWVGLRGNPEQTREAARQFHVYYRLRSLGDGEYTVDHSSFLYVVTPEGRFAKLLADSVSPDQLAGELRGLAR
jgi:protein SCO1/2